MFRLVLIASAAAAGASARADDDPVSFTRDVRPILEASCVACHKPDKMKGELDLTTAEAIRAGGESGAAIDPEAPPDESLLIVSVTGPEPEMPAKGERLREAEVGILRRWISSGAHDDSGEAVAGAAPLPPPDYAATPVVTALAFSPDGASILSAGHGEVFVHDSATGRLTARLASALPRIESLAFTSDGATLVAAGGQPASFGGVDIWAWPSGEAIASHPRLADDLLLGMSVSPDGARCAAGSADGSSRVIALPGGRVEAEFSDHTDWPVAAAIASDGGRFLSASRDKSIRIVQFGAGAQLAWPLNRAAEPILAMIKSPAAAEVVAGTERGGLFAYSVPAGPPEGDVEKDDPHRVREYDRMDGPVLAMTVSADGARLAVSAQGGQIRVFKFAERDRIATWTAECDIYALAFSPDGERLAAGGFDGALRIFTVADQNQPPVEFPHGPMVVSPMP